jgi:hypothetical protein
MRKSIVIILLVAYGSCKTATKEERIAEYVKGQESGLTQKRIVRDAEVILQYLPPQLKLIRLKKGGAVSAEDSSNVYLFDDFKITISKQLWKPDKETMEHLNFKMNEDFGLVKTAGDTLRSSICERMANGSSSVHEFLVSFEHTEGQDLTKTGLQFIYSDQLLDMGILHFYIPGKAIQQIPEINKLK